MYVNLLFLLATACLWQVSRSEWASGVTRAPSPVMGWRSWNFYGCDNTQQITQSIVDGLYKKRVIDGKSMSLADVGYTYVGIDDCWQPCKNPYTCDSGNFHDPVTGKPLVNTSRFPSLAGMVRYGQQRGMEMAFYMNNCRCAERNVTHYPEDAAFSVSLGFTGIKFDTAGKSHNLSEWARQYTLLNTTMIIEGDTKSLAEVRDTCPYTLFRVGDDVAPFFLSAVWEVNLLLPYLGKGLSRPGCWASPDCLEVGVDHWKIRMTHTEQRTHFGLWAIISAPLIHSMDFSNDTAVNAVLDIIANPETIAVNQQWHGLAGQLVLNSNVTFNATVYHGFDGRRNSTGTFYTWQVWSKPLPGPTQTLAVLIVNNNDAQETIKVPLSTLGLPNNVKARDLWARKDVGQVDGAVNATLDSHDSLFLLLRAPTDTHKIEA